MSIRIQFLAPIVMLLAALIVLVETIYFASRQPGYSQISNTISELGESGGPNARLVAFGFFLPVGLLVWLALWLLHREISDRYASLALVAISCLGLGYVMAAFFPCDSGAPLFGSWRTQVHNAFGFFDYEGTGIGFLIISRHFAKRNATFPTFAFFIASALLFLCLALLALEATFPIRGAIQRIAEVIQFTGVFFVCYLLSRNTPHVPKSL